MLSVDDAVGSYNFSRRGSRPKSWANTDNNLKRGSISNYLSKPLLHKSKSSCEKDSKKHKIKELQSTARGLWMSTGILYSVTTELVSNQQIDSKSSPFIIPPMVHSHSNHNLNIKLGSYDETSPSQNTKETNKPKIKKKLAKSFSMGYTHRKHRIEAKRTRSMPVFKSPISVSDLIIKSCRSGSSIQSICNGEEVFIENEDQKSIIEDEIFNERFTNEQLEAVICKTLKDNTESMCYDHLLSIDRCCNISKILEERVKFLLEVDNALFKVVAQVFMAEVTDSGIGFATQSTYRPAEDYFASSAYHTDDMFICAIVSAGRIFELDDYSPTE